MVFCSSSSSSHCSTKQSGTKVLEKCMLLPSQDASIAWTFNPHNATLDIVFFGTFISPSGWVGWGINPISPEMTGTRALIAFPDPNSGQVVLLPYILDPSVKLQKTPLLSKPINDDLHLLSSSAALYGGRMATIHNGAAIHISATLKLLPNKTKIHIVWNRGLYVQGYSPTIHPTSVNDLSSVATVDVLSDITTAKTAATDLHKKRTLKQVHGFLNAISWGLLLPFGAVTARYLRHLPTTNTAAWFYAHAGIQISATLIGTVGFSIGIWLGEMSPGRVFGLHRKLGIAAFCLAWLQTMALLFRPKTTNKFRKYWKSYHHFVGYACVILGVVNVFQGLQIMGDQERSLSSAKLVYCLCLSTLIGVCIALEVNAWVLFCRKAKEDELKRGGLVVGGSASAAISDHFKGNH
ncbi:hypothetical protein Leryth_008466 [Lithospermum erythrorhizon]|nr:hypothetical protein Leryth_008466 [Lithospermum erythrorhizon]